MTEAPKTIWIPTNAAYLILLAKKDSDTYKYIRADRYHACLEAAVSLHHWLFELVHHEHTPEVYADAQLALDKWNRFLDGD